MIVVCEQCNRKFKLDESKVPEGGIKVKCSKCGHTFRVSRPDSQPELSPGSSPDAGSPAPPSSGPGPGTDDFADMFQSGGSSPFESSTDDEFRDLFADESQPDGSRADEDISDLFGSGSPGEGEPSPPSELKSEPEPDLGDFNIGSESEDPFGESSASAAEKGAGEAASFIQSREESIMEINEGTPAGEKKDYPEWGTIEFGEDTAGPDMPELDDEAVEEEFPPEKPAPEPRPPAQSSLPEPVAPEVPREPSRPPAGDKIKPPAGIHEVPRLIIEVTFLVLMVLVLFGMGARFLLSNPPLLKQVGLSSLSDGIFLREIAAKRQVLAFDLESYWIENIEQVPVLVLEGRVFNGTAEATELSRLVAKLLQPDGRLLLSRVMPIGVMVKLEEIRSLSAGQLEELIQKRAVLVKIPPYGEFSFRFPIPGISPQTLSFQIEVE